MSTKVAGGGNFYTHPVEQQHRRVKTARLEHEVEIIYDFINSWIFYFFCFRHFLFSGILQSFTQPRIVLLNEISRTKGIRIVKVVEIETLCDQSAPPLDHRGVSWCWSAALAIHDRLHVMHASLSRSRDRRIPSCSAGDSTLRGCNYKVYLSISVRYKCSEVFNRGSGNRSRALWITSNARTCKFDPATRGIYTAEQSGAERGGWRH